MSGTFQAIGNLVCLVPLIIFLWHWMTRARPCLRGTTVTGAGAWLVVALVAWILTAVLQSTLPFRGPETLPGISTRLNYFSLTLWLTPLVSVLGAKRPGVRFWNFFVLVPMLLMLNWPAFSAERDVLLNTRLDLEAPALMGFFVVLLMVLGNYFGTIFTFPALLFCGALALGLCAGSRSLPNLTSSGLLDRAIVSLLLAGSIFWSRLILKRETKQRQGYERVWLDFRDWFGILWTRRVMDRLNQSAQSEGWQARLTLDRIEWERDLTDEQRAATQEKMDHAFRWIFRRFVDESWIDERLSEP
jgi:hypothetical protein